MDIPNLVSLQFPNKFVESLHGHFPKESIPNKYWFSFLANALRFPVPSRIRAFGAGGICPSGVVLCRGREATTDSAPQCQRRVEGGRGSLSEYGEGR